MMVGFAASSPSSAELRRANARCASLLRRPRAAEALADSRRPQPLASDEAQVASATEAERATNLIQTRCAQFEKTLN